MIVRGAPIQSGNRVQRRFPVVVPNDFLGVHYHRYPVGTTPAPSITIPSVRSHDYQPSGASSNVFWYTLNTSFGNYSWGNLDTWVNTHVAAGRTMIYCVYGTPAFAASAAGLLHNDNYGVAGGADAPTSTTYLNSFITALCQRYLTYLTSGQMLIEAWNEPQFSPAGSEAWVGFFWRDSTDMALMVKTIYQAAKAVDSRIKILCPGFAGGLLCRRVTQFLNASAGAGDFGRQYVDAAAYHFYDTYCATSNAAQGNCQTWIDAYRSALAAGGLDYWVDLYDTEHGYLTPNGDPFLAGTEAQRGLWLKQVLAIEAANGIKSVCLYDYDGTVLGVPNIQNSATIQAELANFQASIPGKIIYSQYVDSSGALVTTTNAGTLTW